MIAKRIIGSLRRRRLAVLWGGASAERAISSRSAAEVLKTLGRHKIACCRIEAGPQVAGALRQRRINLCFLAVHGPFGEDGRLQGLLDVLKIPYTGSGTRASALAMHKPTAKRLFQSASLPTVSEGG